MVKKVIGQVTVEEKTRFKLCLNVKTALTNWLRF